MLKFYIIQVIFIQYNDNRHTVPTIINIPGILHLNEDLIHTTPGMLSSHTNTQFHTTEHTWTGK